MHMLLVGNEKPLFSLESIAFCRQMSLREFRLAMRPNRFCWVVEVELNVEGGETMPAHVFGPGIVLVAHFYVALVTDFSLLSG
jgi:hypothetical protein